MHIGPTEIEATFAEAFTMRFARLVVTAVDEHWARTAAAEATGYGTSVIGCDAEAGLDHMLRPDQTPDGRPGAVLLFFAFSTDAAGEAVAKRVGQCLMTCPTTACFDGLPEAEKRSPLGKQLRYFGDGFQKSKLIDGRRYWRIPVMDGEFVVEESIGLEKGVAGGNIIVQANDSAVGLEAARRAVEAIAEVPGAITPFPGGVVRSGSKVGARYKKLIASTNDAYCPTVRGREEVTSNLLPEAQCVYEVVIDGIDQQAVGRAMAAAARAAAGPGVLRIGAGNYGGKLGKHHFHLHDILG